MFTEYGQDYHYSIKEEKDECVTVGGPKSGVGCVFPFRFQNVTYTTCAAWNETAWGPGQGPWCSTKVNKTGHHASNQVKNILL